MNSFAVAAFVAILAAANASGILAPSANILQGPSSRTTLVGPEGSVISSVSPGGQVITEENPSVAAYAAPAVTSPLVSTYSAPAVATYSSPSYAYPAYAYSAPTYAYSAPSVYAYSAPTAYTYSAPAYSTHLSYSTPVATTGVVGEQSIVSGPSGSIFSGRSFTAPGVATYAASAPVISSYASPAYVGGLTTSSVDTVVAGPSGTITTGKTSSTPSVYAARSIWA